MLEEIDWILFDADHTLFDFDRSSKQALADELATYGNTLSDVQYTDYFRINRECWRQYERGTISREVLATIRFDRFFELHGITGINTSDFNQNYLSRLPGYPFMMDTAMDTLSATRGKVKLGLITNGLKEVQRPRLKASGLDTYFDCIVVSGEIGLAKPDPAYFQHAYNLMGEPDKERVLVVGDSLFADIYGGMKFGFKACWFNSDERTDDIGVNPHFTATSHSDLREILGLD